MTCKLSKKLLVLLLLILLTIITGCDNSSLPTPIANESVQNLTLATSKDISLTAKDSIILFADKVSELSRNSMNIEIIYDDDPLLLLDEGTDLLFAKNEVIARANGDYLSYSSPFYFSNYQQLTLTLNSKSFNELTNDITTSLLSAYPIGAFYDGSNVILSVSDFMFDTIDQFKEHRIYISENEMLEYVFKKFEADVYVREHDKIISGFNSGLYSAIECSTLDLSKIELPSRRENINICKSFHNPSINWLMLSEDLKEELSKEQLAIISEATAFAIAYNDIEIRKIEDAGYEYLATISSALTSPNFGEFGEATDTILKESSKYSNLWNWEMHQEVKKLAN